MDDKKKTELRRQLLLAAWSKGDLKYRFHATQDKIHAAVLATNSPKFFLLCARRLGKSFYLVNRAVGLCLSKPGMRVLYLAPFAKNAADIANDLVTQLLEDCPPQLRPRYNSVEKELLFKNGSIVRFKGVNGEHAQYLRGGAADEVILDECGLMDDLRHVVSDICLPMTMTTGGRILLASTPPRSPGHESVVIYEQLAAENAVAKFTIRDAPHVTDAVKTIYLKEAGETVENISEILAGNKEPTTTTAKREYFCDFVTDLSAAVVPEFTPELRKDIVIDWKRPEEFDAYVAMDPGIVDRTGILYAYWDFEESKLVIESESLLVRASTSMIAKEIRLQEKALWGGDKKPFMRVSDIELRLIADLQELHGILFSPTPKKDSLAAVNYMRNMFERRQIIILPNCVNLTRQLTNAIWNHKGSDMARAGESSIDGHYDLVAALKYLCRNVQRHRNPNGIGPTIRPGVHNSMWVSPKSLQKSRLQQLGVLDDTPLGRKLSKLK